MSNPPPTEPTSQPPAPAALAAPPAPPSTTELTMPPAVDPSANPDAASTVDAPMADAPDVASSPAPAPQAAPSPAPAAPPRTGTPSRNLNGGDASSRAGSVHPDTSSLNLPNAATPHGDSARMYINSTVTAALLEGMKKIGRDQPANPLKVLGEFLIQKSRERGEPESS
ncbi:dpy-30 motif family protein [Colletotrichum kahawae]|uniref:Dpy-30 motif family protein n=1 Tax=Colletotrichum kahawae TaxID=34407 RepID=A0AAE0CX79_COLKA|nr:dpy-30 motif family protein [Colletotrichum kahawae]